MQMSGVCEVITNCQVDLPFTQYQSQGGQFLGCLALCGEHFIYLLILLHQWHSPQGSRLPVLASLLTSPVTGPRVLLLTLYPYYRQWNDTFKVTTDCSSGLAFYCFHFTGNFILLFLLLIPLLFSYKHVSCTLFRIFWCLLEFQNMWSTIRAGMEILSI